MINGAREDIRWVENCWIPTPDGIRLAATIWLPRNAEISPVPAVLEIVPYRKRDHTAVRDEQLHSGLARSGFAGIRVDMRGSGDSEGVFDAHRTYDDVLHILAWIRSQAWCTGDLGMIGLSWGGLNAIMAAERQPPGLGAVVACSFSHDRYGVGMMWKNGCLLSENFAWATSVTSFCSRPPDPAVVGAGWREMWLDRLSNLEPQVQHYLGHQRRDDYWDMHRVTDLGRISCPVYAFAGWADSNYTQTLPALLTNASGPVKAVIGPWGHKYPYQAVPGPGSISSPRRRRGLPIGSAENRMVPRAPRSSARSSSMTCPQSPTTLSRRGDGSRSPHGRSPTRGRPTTICDEVRWIAALRRSMPSRSDRLRR